MYLRFNCAECQKDKWMIDYETEERVHKLTCINCGRNEVLEYVLSPRRSKHVKQSKPTNNIAAKPSVTDRGGSDKAEGNTGKVWLGNKERKDVVGNNQGVKA